jgi:hypothetical protein
VVSILQHGDALVDLSNCCSAFEFATSALGLEAVWEALLFPFDSRTALCCGGTSVFHESIHVIARSVAWHWPCSRVRLYANACFRRAFYTSSDWAFHQKMGVLDTGGERKSLRTLIKEFDCETPIPLAAQTECFYALASQATVWFSAPYDCGGASSTANRYACIDGVARGSVSVSVKAGDNPDRSTCTRATQNGTLVPVSWCISRIDFYQREADAGEDSRSAHLKHLGHLATTFPTSLNASENKELDSHPNRREPHDAQTP